MIGFCCGVVVVCVKNGFTTTSPESVVLAAAVVASLLLLQFLPFPGLCKAQNLHVGPPIVGFSESNLSLFFLGRGCHQRLLLLCLLRLLVVLLSLLMSSSWFLFRRFIMFLERLCILLVWNEDTFLRSIASFVLLLSWLFVDL